MKATITEPTSTKAAFSVAHSNREKDSPPFSVNLSISGAHQGGLAASLSGPPSPDPSPAPQTSLADATLLGGAMIFTGHPRDVSRPNHDRDTASRAASTCTGTRWAQDFCLGLSPGHAPLPSCSGCTGKDTALDDPVLEASQVFHHDVNEAGHEAREDPDEGADDPALDLHRPEGLQDAVRARVRQGPGAVTLAAAGPPRPPAGPGIMKAPVCTVR